MPGPNDEEAKREAAAAAAAAAGVGLRQQVAMQQTVMSTEQFNMMMASFTASSNQVAQAVEIMQQVVAPAAAQGGDGQPAHPAQQVRTDRFSKRMPDFWEDRPTMWFELLAGEFQECGVVEQRSKFCALLQLLGLKGRDLLAPLMAQQPEDAFDQAKKLLLEQFERTKEEKMEEMLAVTSLGDRTPLQMLHYLRSLCPDDKCPCITVVLRRVLPDAARQGSRHLEDLNLLAERATAIMKATGSLSHISAVEQPLPFEDSSSSTPLEVAAVARPVMRSTGVAPVGNRNSWCRRHKRWRERSFGCDQPESCPMRNVICQRPPSGNGPAGRQ